MRHEGHFDPVAMLKRVPKFFWAGAAVIVCFGMVPPAVIFYMRTAPKRQPRIHLIQNMDNQPKFKAQQTNELFRDNRAMRPPVAGTVSRDAMTGDTHLWLGTVDGAFASTYPASITVDRALMDRGRERYDIYCLPCHGVTGDGQGPVHKRAMQLMENGTNGTAWVQPRSIHEDAVVEQSPGRIFHTISNGLNNMAGYASQIPVEDRWAIVAWVEALQVSRNAPPEEVPGNEHFPEVRRQLDEEAAAPSPAEGGHDHASHDPAAGGGH
ncbi:MAG: cytochrome c [Phycisphaerales bacterium]|nr:cytochrome c [Phycisphaerales bacterium]